MINSCGNRRAYPVGMTSDDDRKSNCICDSQPISLAMAYVKDQEFNEIYNASQALCNGTLFPELNKPYCLGGRR